MENIIKKKRNPKTKKKAKIAPEVKIKTIVKSLKEKTDESKNRDEVLVSKEVQPEQKEAEKNDTSMVVDSNGKEREDNSHLAKWTAPSFILTNGEVFIYRLCAIGSPFMIVWSLLQGSYIVSITFLLALIASVMHIERKPENMECLIDLDGIKMGERIYNYDLVESFEVDDETKVLKFKLKNAIFPIKEIYLEDQDPNYIRAVLEYFLPEEKQEAVLLSRGKREAAGEAEMTDEELHSYLERMEEKIEKERS